MESFKTYLPCPQLTPYIFNYWALETSGTQPVSERVIPFGNMQLIFHRENPLYSAGQNEFQPLAFISGMSNRYADIASSDKIKMLVVSFRPEGARALLKAPLQLFHNSNVSTDDVEDLELKTLGRAVCSEGNDTRCIEIIEKFFLKRLEKFDRFNLQRLLPSIQLINSSTQISISSLSDSACLSPKQFKRVFTEYIGSTPKEFQRIVRFQRALFILQTKPYINLTQLAFEAGYYDQPHLIKDFREFSGYTPKAFLSICPPVSDYFTYQ